VSSEIVKPIALVVESQSPTPEQVKIRDSWLKR